MGKRILTIIAALCIALTSLYAGSAPVTPKGKAQKKMESVRREQQQTRKAIKETSRQISANTAETRRQLSRLNSLNSEIAAKNEEISGIQLSVDSLDRRIGSLNDSIAAIQSVLENMRRSYAKALSGLQGNESAMNSLAFIFAAESFADAWRRARYMRQYDRWRRGKTTQLRSTTQRLSGVRERLDSTASLRRNAIARLDGARRELQSSRTETDRIVADLKSQGASLKAVLREKEQQARRLDRELDRLIAEEQKRIERERREQERKRREAERKAAAERKTGKDKSQTGTSVAKKSPASGASTSIAAADRALSGSFESNKGRLLFPVSGKYRIVRGFGRQRHPELQHVETENSGIDIEALGSRSARAIFAGKVSAIFRQPGYGNIVMIRHGNYLSVYANLDAINVKNGDTVAAGQNIGSILIDPDEDNRAILHFELRRERAKLNPVEWVR